MRDFISMALLTGILLITMHLLIRFGLLVCHALNISY